MVFWEIFTRTQPYEALGKATGWLLQLSLMERFGAGVGIPLEPLAECGADGRVVALIEQMVRVAPTDRPAENCDAVVAELQDIHAEQARQQKSARRGGRKAGTASTAPARPQPAAETGPAAPAAEPAVAGVL